MNDYMNQVWPPPAEEQDSAPLAGTPPVMTEPEPLPAGPARRKVLAMVWYIVFASICLAVAWTLLTAPNLADEYCTSPLQPLAAAYLPLILWGITLLVRKVTR